MREWRVFLQRQSLHHFRLPVSLLPSLPDPLFKLGPGAMTPLVNLCWTSGLAKQTQNGVATKLRFTMPEGL